MTGHAAGPSTGPMVSGMAFLLTAAAVVGSTATACEPMPDIIENERLDVWCSKDTLCSWENEGTIRRVGTWHPHDYGVSFEDERVVISQLAHDAAGCLLFYGLAAVDRDVRLTVELDIFDDGEVEFVRRLKQRDFSPTRFDVQLAHPAPHTRVILRKEGSGKAVLAQFFVDEGDDCDGPIVEAEGGEGKLGDPCTGDSDCYTGVCATLDEPPASVCSDCSGAWPCDDEQDCVQHQESRYLVCDRGSWKWPPSDGGL